MAFRSFGWDVSLSGDIDFNLRVWDTEIYAFTYSIIQQILLECLLYFKNSAGFVAMFKLFIIY